MTANNGKENPVLEDIQADIRTFIVEEVLEEVEDAASVPQDIPLLSGLLDSFGLMSLISFLEDRYGLIIKNDQVTKQNFASVSVLARFIEEKKREALASEASA